MNAPKDGGSAFPRTGFECDTHTVSQYDTQPLDGMTLRDYFAAKALAGPAVVNDSGCIRTPSETALIAYQLADAMLAARERTP